MKKKRFISLLLTVVVMLSMATITNAEVLEVAVPVHMHDAACDSHRVILCDDSTGNNIVTQMGGGYCGTCGSVLRIIVLTEEIYEQCPCWSGCPLYILTTVTYRYYICYSCGVI